MLWYFCPYVIFFFYPSDFWPACFAAGNYEGGWVKWFLPDSWWQARRLNIWSTSGALVSLLLTSYGTWPGLMFWLLSELKIETIRQETGWEVPAFDQKHCAVILGIPYRFNKSCKWNVLFINVRAQHLPLAHMTSHCVIGAISRTCVSVTASRRFLFIYILTL